MPEEWRKGLTIPIFKKGDPNICSNYHGITLLNTAYKILTTIINNRLSRYTEREGVIDEHQFGFKRGKCTIDAIHIITHNNGMATSGK